MSEDFNDKFKHILCNQNVAVRKKIDGKLRTIIKSPKNLYNSVLLAALYNLQGKVHTGFILSLDDLKVLEFIGSKLNTLKSDSGNNKKSKSNLKLIGHIKKNESSQ